MAKQPCVPCAPPRPPPAAPLWLDPAAVLNTVAYRTSVVTFSGFGAATVARPDPKRTAIGFFLHATSGFQTRVSPSGMDNNYGWALTSLNQVVWLDLFTYGPLVVAGWSGSMAGAGTMAIVEVYRLY